MLMPTPSLALCFQGLKALSQSRPLSYNNLSSIALLKPAVITGKLVAARLLSTTNVNNNEEQKMRELTTTEITSVSGGLGFDLSGLSGTGTGQTTSSFSMILPGSFASINGTFGLGISGTGGSFDGGSIGSSIAVGLSGGSSLEKDS
jgi:hypothetical protein